MFEKQISNLKNIFLFFLSVDIFVQINYSLSNLICKKGILDNDWFGLSRNFASGFEFGNN